MAPSCRGWGNFVVSDKEVAQATDVKVFFLLSLKVADHSEYLCKVCS